MQKPSSINSAVDAIMHYLRSPTKVESVFDESVGILTKKTARNKTPSLIIGHENDVNNSFYMHYSNEFNHPELRVGITGCNPSLIIKRDGCYVNGEKLGNCKCVPPDPHHLIVNGFDKVTGDGPIGDIGHLRIVSGPNDMTKPSFDIYVHDVESSTEEFKKIITASAIDGVTIHENTTFSNNVVVDGGLVVNGADGLTVNNDVNVSKDLTVEGDMLAKKSIQTQGNITGNELIGQNIYITDASNNNKIIGTASEFICSVPATFNDNVDISGAVNIAGNTTFTAPVFCQSNFTMVGMFKSEGLATFDSITTGDIAVDGYVTTKNITASGDITTTNIAATSVRASGMVSGNTVSASGSITATGDITATGNVYGNNFAATGKITGNNVTVTDSVSAKTVTVSENIKATGDISTVNIDATGDISATGEISAASVSTTTVSATGNITSSETVSAKTITTTGAVSGNTLAATTSITTPSIKVGETTISETSNKSQLTINKGLYISDIELQSGIKTPMVAVGSSSTTDTYRLSQDSDENFIITYGPSTEIAKYNSSTESWTMKGLESLNLTHAEFLMQELPDQYTWKTGLWCQPNMMKVWDNGDGIHAIQIDFGHYFIMDQNYGDVFEVTIVFTKSPDNTSEKYVFQLRRDSEDKLRYSVKCVNIVGNNNGEHFTSVKVSGSGRYLTIQQSTYPYADPAQYTVSLAPFQFNAFSRATVDTSTMTAKYTEVLNANNARIDDLVNKYGEAMARCARLEKIVGEMINYNNASIPALFEHLNAASVDVDSSYLRTYVLYSPPDTANGNPADDTNFEDAAWNTAPAGFYTINPRS